MIVMAGLPVRLVENTAFKTFCHAMDPKYTGKI